jgi:CelD/BcsL family acetyltransferase involved in cellulose biosynthesis
VHETLTAPPSGVPKENGTSKMLYRIEPLKDSRWEKFLELHPRASVFHSPAWLEALSRTYGYQSIAYTTSPPDEDLQNGIVFCRVESWLTGRRLVSLPFSDHCELLVDKPEDLQTLVAGLEQELRNESWRYIEIRPRKLVEITSPLCRPTAKYSFHQLSLEPDLDTIFRNCHKDSTQRKILRAQRAGLKYQEGATESLLDAFYRLLVITRRRHHVPPQPKNWFHNLLNCFGEALKIRLALKDGRAVAGMLTLRHKDTLIYKYGGSDARFNQFGGMHLLYWESIRDAKNSGLRMFDLGRSDARQAGLIKFKSRWGATQSALTYSRYAESGNSEHIFDHDGTNWKMRMLKSGFGQAPSFVLSALGNLLYKHVG